MRMKISNQFAPFLRLFGGKFDWVSSNASYRIVQFYAFEHRRLESVLVNFQCSLLVRIVRCFDKEQRIFRWVDGRPRERICHK